MRAIRNKSFNLWGPISQLPPAVPPPCRGSQFAHHSTDDPEKSMARNLRSRARGNKKGKLDKRWATSHCFVTLLTPTDDPNTFELVARNLKMKARGNQKSNEASQIKSSPHDTEHHQKNRQKANQNRWKSRLGLVLGALGGGLGCHLGSQGRLAQKKGAR